MLNNLALDGIFVIIYPFENGREAGTRETCQKLLKKTSKRQRKIHRARRPFSLFPLHIITSSPSIVSCNFAGPKNEPVGYALMSFSFGAYIYI